MKSQNAKWVAMAAMGVMIGMTACNKKSEESASKDIREESGEAIQDIKETAQASAEKVREEAAQTTRDIKEGADKAVSKVKEESRQATRDAKEGTQTAAEKTREESRQATRDTKEGASNVKQEARQTARDIDEAARNSVALAKAPRPGDVGATKVDEQIIARIRAELSKHNDISSEVKDIAIKADNGKITLNGTVTSSEIRREMARITGKEEGVKSVNNELKVAERVGAGTSD